MVAVTCLPIWRPSARVSLTWKTRRGGPVPGYGSAQEPEVGIESEKLHWEEEVIRPVIFGNNYDPLQEVIVSGEREGLRDHLLVVSNCVQRGSCGSVRTCSFHCTRSLGSGQCGMLHLAPGSLRNTALHAPTWTLESKLLLEKTGGFPSGE